MIGILLQNCHIAAMSRGFEKRISRNLPFPLAGRTVLWAVDKNQEARENCRKKELSDVYLLSTQSTRFILGRIPQETLLKYHKNM